MIDPVNEFDAHVGARLLDFFDSRSPWNRKLWNVGLSLTLREVLEATDAVRAGVLSQDSFGFLVNVAQRIAGTDPGAGTLEERRLLQSALRSKPRRDGLDYHVIAEQELKSRPLYLARWATALRGTDRPRAERTARSIGSHLLDIGYSSDFLHRWWKYRLQHQSGICSIANMVDDAQQLASKRSRNFDVMVPVSRAIHLKGGRPPKEWHSPRQVSEWLRHNRFDVAGVRQDGGFLFTIPALDTDAAVIRVSEVLDQLCARVAVGARRGLALLGRVWIGGDKESHQMDRARRGVWVEALQRENQLYDAHSTGGIHAAIELLSHLQSSSPGAAVAGGWAAIEALLSDPGDRVGAADRLAVLVACSLPRAELTVLSYTLARSDPAVADLLRGIDENRQRCDCVADALVAQTINSRDLAPSDRAGAARILEVLTDPHHVLSVVHDYAAIAFRRLYRQRNLVLHAGKTDAVALRASLRTAAPLVGAGIDRIIHASYVNSLSPLQLVAQAKLALATVGASGGPRCTDLLGRDSIREGIGSN